ncbi:MAG TPA: MarR family transcriptional regulator [Acidimicrobiales bacterium]|nr:MarR family transcriptional regulator [Acidimicrobiales bacterium]
MTSLAPTPSRSTTDAELAARLRLAVNRLARRLRQHADADISPSQLSALATLARSGPLTVGELSSAERVKPPTMTRVVASLEEVGLVTRTIDPEDRRVAHVATTPTGDKLIARSRSRKDAYLAARLHSLSAEDRTALDHAATLLEGMLEDGR